MLVPERHPLPEEAREDMASRAGGQREAGPCRGLRAIGPLQEGDAHALHSNAYKNPGRDKVHTPFTPGCFLMGLPRLRSLELQNVLDARRWQDDARYVAALTELTELVMYFFGCELEEDVSSFTLAQVQPLTTLTQLNSLRISEPWASGMACPEFQQALNGPRHQMGLPPVRLVLDGIWNMFGSC
eukprot:jgi/Botrbrau1/13260/Bobra.0074s0008.1